ncbi:hypothetical protein L6R53_26660 [Myxococcota bacterium]|nr:hypothetical protein [Myxococcota bacterium]
MSQTASKEALKLKKLLSELFQLDDAASLDFGIYRILAQRRDEMERFLNELVSGIPARLAEAAGGERERLQAELDAYVRRRQEDGDDLDDVRGSKRYKELADKVGSAVDVRELARDVFRDLHAFFSRYWDEGDFMAVPRYDRDTYAIPYDGSEVALHWANRDQYYVKSTVFFNDMTVRDPSWPGTLRFELAAAVTDRDNAKGADANKRRFSLALEEAPVREEGKNLVVRLRYGPWSEAEDAAEEGEDTDEESGDETEGGDDTGPGKKARTLKQDKLDELTAIRILEQAPPAWQLALGRQIRREGEKKGQTEILRRLRRYTKGNTADFFIHKNLRKFLRRELDFFIKNEVFDLDNIDRADLATLDAKLKRVRALRGLAHDLIDWLHQIEDFQRRLFLKKKLVLRTDWAVTLDRVPRELWPRIAKCAAQVERWRDLFAIDDIPKDMFAGRPVEGRIDESFLEKHQGLLVETATLGSDLAAQVVAGVCAGAPLDEQIRGTIIRSPNHAALSLLERGTVPDYVYLDPPFNTSEAGFLYKNEYRHSTWLSMVFQALVRSYELLPPHGLMSVAIDDAELFNLGSGLDQTFGTDRRLGVLVVEIKPSGRTNDNFLSTSHEYYLWLAKDPTKADICYFDLDETAASAYSEADEDGDFKWRDFLRTGGYSTPEERPNSYYTVYFRDKDGYIGVENKPGAIAILPLDSEGAKRVWRKTPPSFLEHVGRGDIRVERGRGGAWKVRIKDRIKDGIRPKSVWVGAKYDAASHGTKRLQAMFGEKATFSYPKSLHAVYDAMWVAVRENEKATVLDFFAGSGTTGHAVLALNREDGGDRRFVLVEMGEHFDTALVPRILKATYSKDWKDGKPVDRKSVSALYKIIRLESYDDTLENIALERPNDRQEALFGGGGTTGVGKDYLIRYMLHMEAGRSLLDKERFATPFDYRIRALVTKRDEQGASWSAVEETPVDLVETFNYLLGLRVKTMRPLGRDGDMAKARYVEGVRRDSRGDWCIKVLVVWRDCSKVDDQALDDLFARAQFTEAGADGRRYIADFDEVYVNGDNRLPNQRLDGERWKVTLIEEEFHRLMFDVADEE